MKKRVCFLESTIYSCFILGIILSVIQLSNSQQCAKNYKKNPSLKVEKCILQNYDTNVRPIRNIQNSTRVTLEYAVIDVTFNSKYKLFSIFGAIKADWQDEFLVWKPQDYDNVLLISTDSKKIWTPRLTYEGIPGAPFQSLFTDTLTDVSSDGNVTYLNYVSIDAKCDSHLKYYPRDEHICLIMLWPNDDINVTLINTDATKPIDSDVQGLVQNSLEGLSSIRSVFRVLNVTLSEVKVDCVESDCEKNSLQAIEILFHIQRETSVFSLIYMKAFITGILLQVPFFLPPANIARFAIPIITFFVSLYQIDKIDAIVNIYTSQDIPFIVYFYRNVLFLSLLVVLESFVYIQLSESSLPLPNSVNIMYMSITRRDTYVYLKSMRTYFNFQNAESETLVEDSKLPKTHTFKDLVQLVDVFLSYIMQFLIFIFFLLLVFG